MGIELNPALWDVASDIPTKSLTLQGGNRQKYFLKFTFLEKNCLINKMPIFLRSQLA